MKIQNKKKMISIFTPCYNEEGNVYNLCMAIKNVMSKLPEYDYEHILSDNCSTDNTWSILKNIAKDDKHVKIIENERNFGPSRSGSHGFFQTSGDASICLACDFQDPPELIIEFIKKWEEGYKVVWGKKTSSQESKRMFLIRSIYYKIIKSCSDTKQYEHVTGFGLYDKSVVDILRDANEPEPNFRNLIAEYGYDVGLIEYEQPMRQAGKSSYNFFRYWNTAINSLINTTKAPLRIATFIGGFLSAISFIIAIVYLILKLIYWDRFIAGTAPILIGFFFMGGIQLLFLGIIGEYVGEVLSRVTKRPLVIEKERINFDIEEEE